MIVKWEGQEFEAVDRDDMLLAEAAACEKWLGAPLEDWGTVQTSMAILWVTLKRRLPQFARSRVEAIAVGKLTDYLVMTAEEEAAAQEAMSGDQGAAADPTPAAADRDATEPVPAS